MSSTGPPHPASPTPIQTHSPISITASCAPKWPWTWWSQGYLGLALARIWVLARHWTWDGPPGFTSRSSWQSLIFVSGIGNGTGAVVDSHAKGAGIGVWQSRETEQQGGEGGGGSGKAGGSSSELVPRGGGGCTATKGAMDRFNPVNMLECCGGNPPKCWRSRLPNRWGTGGGGVSIGRKGFSRFTAFCFAHVPQMCCASFCSPSVSCCSLPCSQCSACLVLCA